VEYTRILSDFGKFTAFHGAGCCKLLHEYSVLQPPGHVDFWHMQHFKIFFQNKNCSDLIVEIEKAQNPC
jgi:hypothetical protein